MKRILNIVGGLLGLLVLVGLAVALAMTFSGLRREVQPLSQALQSPIETPTLPPYPPPATPTPPGPPATPTVAPTPIPRCTFAARPAPVEPGPPLEAYQFSEPKIVLTHPAAIGIAGWLPDGQRLLITRDVPGTNRQSIDVLDVQTGELSTYAEREGSSGKPVWLAALKAVAYLTLVAEKGEEQPIRYHPELWISYGSPQRVECLISDVWGALAVEPDGKRLWYFSRANLDRPQQLNVETKAIQPAPLDLAPLRYPKYPEPVQSMLGLSAFQIAWHPDGSQLVFYTQPWTFLFDMRTNQICEIDLGRSEPENMPIWAMEAKWSPNGRYLAFITIGSLPDQASGTGAAILYTDLTILDTRTGDLRTLQPAPDINPGQHYVTDIAWAHDSRHLAVLGLVRMDEVGIAYDGLFFVDAVSGEFRRILPDHEFGGAWGWEAAWSPSGSLLAVLCPRILNTSPPTGEGGLCTVQVNWE